MAPESSGLVKGDYNIWEFVVSENRRYFSYFRYATTRNRLMFRGVECTYGQIKSFHLRMIRPIEDFPRRLVTGTPQFDQGMRAYARQLDDFILHRAPEPPQPW